jgi:hypothetical protein
VGYLTTAENASLVLSYNLAVGGASIDNSLVQGSTNVDLVSQVGIFDETYSSKPDSAPWTAENAVFGFWIGINEYVGSWLATIEEDDLRFESSIGNAFYKTDADTFTPQLIARLTSLGQQIYSAGGRKFLFLNVPPTSRSPMFLNQGQATVEQHAAYLAVYNKNLEAMVDGFKANHTDVSTRSVLLYFRD